MPNNQRQVALRQYVLFFIFLVCSGCINEIAGKAKFKTVYLHAQTGSIEIIQNDLGVIFEVRNKFGIGNGEIHLLEGSWPNNSMVRLYLKGLEGLSISNPNKNLSKSDLEIKQYKNNGDSYFEFEIPISLLTSTKVVKLSWIDFYR
jgi:hypothetical protein